MVPDVTFMCRIIAAKITCDAIKHDGVVNEELENCNEDNVYVVQM